MNIAMLLEMAADGMGDRVAVGSAVVVIYFGGGALYWKWRLARQRRQRQP